jgi:hypothetical protein
MRYHRFRKALTFGLALALVFSMALPALSEAKDPLGKYDPPINITFVRAVDEDLNSNVLPKTPGETMEKNRWLDLIPSAGSNST